MSQAKQGTLTGVRTTYKVEVEGYPTTYGLDKTEAQRIAKVAKKAGRKVFVGECRSIRKSECQIIEEG